MRIRLSRRTIILVALSFAIGTTFVTLAVSKPDDMTMFLASIAGSLVAVPLTFASIAFDMVRTRRSAELAAFFAFVAMSLAGIAIGFLPAVR